MLLRLPPERVTVWRADCHVCHWTSGSQETRHAAETLALKHKQEHPAHYLILKAPK